MNRITRHVVADLLRVFSISVCVMTGLMVMLFLVQEALRENLTLDTIVELIPYTIPTALSFSIPGTILFAVCIVYGRMSAANEIVAIKAQGIPPSRVVWPAVVMAFLLSLFTLYLNDVAASWGRSGVYRVVLNASAKTIYSVLSSQGSFNKGSMTIVVDGVEGDVLINPHVEKLSKDGDGLQVRAEQAQLIVSPNENALIFRVKNAIIEVGDKINPILMTVDEEDIPIPLGDGPGDSPSNTALREMQSQLVLQEQLIKNRKQDMAMKAAFQMAGGNMMALTSPEWNNELKDLKTDVKRKHRLHTEPWRRWANGFSCLCFVLVGAPLAIYMRRSDFWTIFAVCFIPILLAYYPLLMFGVSKAKAGELPGYTVWLANIAMILVGFYLIRKIERQ